MNPSSIPFLTMAGLVLAAGADLARGQCQGNELTRMLASDGAVGDQLGFAVDIDGDVAVVGARYGDGMVADSGAVYVIGFSGADWSEQDKLTADDGMADDVFGRAVAIWNGSPRRVAVGAARANAAGTNSGAAYVFRDDGGNWVQEQRLLGGDTGANDNFGYSMDIGGDVVVVGARAVAGWTGAVYVFRHDGQNWVQEQKLTAADGAGGDQFGHVVAIDDDAILVGAYSDDNENGTDAGSAYVFRFNGVSWDQEAKLRAAVGGQQDFFGWSVALDRSTAVVGAYADDDNGAQSGSAYVFGFDGQSWSQQQLLLASDGDGGDRFGYDVAVFADVIVVGAYLDEPSGLTSGSAYVYGNGGPSWVEQAKLIASDGAPGDQMAHGVAISAGTLIAGAPKDDDNGGNSGSAYFFAGLADCNTSGTLDLCDLVSGTSADLNANGRPDECETIPAVSTWGAIAMAVVLLAAGAAVMRRRNGAPA